MEQTLNYRREELKEALVALVIILTHRKTTIFQSYTSTYPNPKSYGEVTAYKHHDTLDDETVYKLDHVLGEKTFSLPNEAQDQQALGSWSLKALEPYRQKEAIRRKTSIPANN